MACPFLVSTLPFRSSLSRCSLIRDIDGTLRWQAPELMSGLSDLTQQIDVYAFAITCVELLTKGALPWAMADDDAVRHFVLRTLFLSLAFQAFLLTTIHLGEDMRPEPPLQRLWSTQLSEILHSCWHRDPSVRPPFMKIDHDVQALRARFGSDIKESPIPPRRIELEDMRSRKSPDMHPIPLPLLPREVLASRSRRVLLTRYIQRIPPPPSSRRTPSPPRTPPTVPRSASSPHRPPCSPLRTTRTTRPIPSRLTGARPAAARRRLCTTGTRNTSCSHVTYRRRYRTSRRRFRGTSAGTGCSSNTNSTRRVSPPTIYRLGAIC